MGKSIAILTLAIVIVAIFFLGMDGQMNAGSQREVDASTSIAEQNRVSVTHAFKDGIHRYTGTFLLPHSCFKVIQSGAWRGDKIEISFQVEDVLATEKTCAKIKTRYPFTIIVEAPENAPAEFVLNDEVVPSKIRESDWQSASGNFINTDVTSPVIQ